MIMDENLNLNYAELCGSMASPPMFSHASRGESFYVFPLSVERLSGTEDIINIIVRESDLSEIQPQDEEKIRIIGEVRSYNNKSGGGAKLVITVFAKKIELVCGEDENVIRLAGTLCKAPNKRTTPMGRDICDLMLAVNRRYGRSDYLPCIAWGTKALRAAEWQVGTRVTLEGRIQSRSYIKILGDVPIEKTAYEISVIEIEENPSA